MKTNDSYESKGRTPGKKPYRMIGAAILVVALGLVVVWFTVVRGGEEPASQVETFVVKRGPLAISVIEAGSLKAKDPEIIRNTLEGRATVISIIPEGTRVSKGDLLIELDVSTLRDSRIDQVIMVNNARAAWIDANEARAITLSQGKSDVEAAQLKFDFAKLDLEKYEGQGGQFETDLAKAEGDIALNQQELEKNTDFYAWSKKLADEKYLSQTQLQADKLTMDKSGLNLKVAKNSLELLKKYTKQRQLAQLQSDVSQAEAALERAKAKARANNAQVQAAFAAKDQEFQRQKDKLAKIDDQIGKGKILAPTDGMVVYATSAGGGHGHEDRPPLADGVQVWERQELIYLPKSTSTIAEVGIREASLQKVRLGLPAMVTIEALPGKKFMGTVTRIAPLPDPQSMWMNPDLKIYKTEIAMEADDPQLRSGMNCKAEIIVEQHADTICVPVQSVLRVGGRPTVFVLDAAGDITERQVEIGLDDNNMIRISRGLEEGEQVLLTPPLKAGVVAPESRLAGVHGVDANDLMRRIQEKLQAPAPAKPVTPRPISGKAAPAQNG